MVETTNTTGSTMSHGTTGTANLVETDRIDNETSMVESEAAGSNPHRAEAKSRFSAALEEAKAGAAALKAEAGERVGTYKTQAKGKGSDLATEARLYGDQAKEKAGTLATDGKAKASEAMASLSRTISENATYVDDKLGVKYGDYARTASAKLQDASASLDAKSIEELGEDAREFVRKSPGTAIGIAAVVGFLVSRLFRSSK